MVGDFKMNAKEIEFLEIEKFVLKGESVSY